MKVLLLSAYAANSHVYWQTSLQAMFPDWNWQLLSLPPRHFSWRVRGNPLVWSLQKRDVLECHYDLVVATSMVDLATLRGLVPALSAFPSVVYFHENQFAYPQQAQQHSLLEAQMVSIYSALAADRVAFNSQYNLTTFMDGCAALMKKLPDITPAELVPLLHAKASVLPVALGKQVATVSAGSWPGSPGELPQRPVRICWLGRFEYDKGPQGLFEILQVLETTNLDYELAVTGQQFRQSPAIFNRIAKMFAHRLVQFGYADTRAEFEAVLCGADIVLSTAVHEFQGLAVAEAVARDCLPVIPDRLAYCEMYPAEFRYTSSPDDPLQEARSAAQLIGELVIALTHGCVRRPSVAAYSQAALAARYAALFLDVTRADDSQ